MGGSYIAAQSKVEKMATELAEAIEVVPGSARYHQIVGCLTELVENCIEAVKDAGGDNEDYHA